MIPPPSRAAEGCLPSTRKKLERINTVERDSKKWNIRQHVRSSVLTRSSVVHVRVRAYSVCAAFLAGRTETAGCRGRRDGAFRVLVIACRQTTHTLVSSFHQLTRGIPTRLSALLLISYVSFQTLYILPTLILQTSESAGEFASIYMIYTEIFSPAYNTAHVDMYLLEHCTHNVSFHLLPFATQLSRRR